MKKEIKEIWVYNRLGLVSVLYSDGTEETFRNSAGERRKMIGTFKNCALGK